MKTTHIRLNAATTTPAVLEDGSAGIAAYATVEIRLCGRGSGNGPALSQLGHKIDCLVEGIGKLPEPMVKGVQ